MYLGQFYDMVFLMSGADRADYKNEDVVIECLIKRVEEVLGGGLKGDISKFSFNQKVLLCAGFPPVESDVDVYTLALNALMKRLYKDRGEDENAEIKKRIDKELVCNDKYVVINTHKSAVAGFSHDLEKQKQLAIDLTAKTSSKHVVAEVIMRMNRSTDVVVETNSVRVHA